MLFRHLIFQTGQGVRQFEPIRSQQLFALRVTPRTLEFGYIETNRTEAVMIVTGENLAELVPNLIHDKERTIGPGHPVKSKPWIRVETVKKFSTFTKLAGNERLAPEQNKVPSWLFCVDCGRERWYMGADNLESFGSEREPRERLFLQFRPRLGFILEPIPGAFNLTLRELKESNLDVGCRNKFSVFQKCYYVRGSDLDRWKIAKIHMERKDLASMGQWSPEVDYRVDYDHLTPAQACELGVLLAGKQDNGGGSTTAAMEM